MKLTGIVLRHRVIVIAALATLAVAVVAIAATQGNPADLVSRPRQLDPGVTKLHQ